MQTEYEKKLQEFLAGLEKLAEETGYFIAHDFKYEMQTSSILREKYKIEKDGISSSFKEIIEYPPIKPGPHKYKCECGYHFTADDTYGDNPQKRHCPSCHTIGRVGYYGNGQWKTGIISDHMGNGVNGLKSMGDGKLYDSKSQYRKSLKEQGLVELGTDAPTEGNSEQRGDYNCEADVAKAVRQVEAYKRTGNPDIFKE